jgi:hypothetical protein
MGAESAKAQRAEIDKFFSFITVSTLLFLSVFILSRANLVKKMQKSKIIRQKSATFVTL